MQFVLTIDLDGIQSYGEIKRILGNVAELDLEVDPVAYLDSGYPSVTGCIQVGWRIKK